MPGKEMTETKLGMYVFWLQNQAVAVLVHSKHPKSIKLLCKILILY